MPRRHDRLALRWRPDDARLRDVLRLRPVERLLAPERPLLAPERRLLAPERLLLSSLRSAPFPSFSCMAVSPVRSFCLVRARLRLFFDLLSYFEAPASDRAMAIA